MKTSPTSLKIRQIITQLKEGKLVPRPEFQRRLVWTSEDKIRFIDTILRGYPFPEIYLANGNVDVDTGEGQQLLVDGQQRVTTLAAYFQGDPSTFGTMIPSYTSLEKEEKESFLNYDVAVRDLGSVNSEEIIEVFKRINATKYSLNEVEVNNAIYAGELMRLASTSSTLEFFEKHRIFRPSDIKRMGDVRFMLQVIITMLGGYFNRDDLFEQYLSDNNDHFPERDAVDDRLQKCFDYIDECGFPPRSRIWKRSDIFTALVQVDIALCDNAAPDPLNAVQRAESFFEEVDGDEQMWRSQAVGIYAKASLQASNDRINRVRRGVIFEAVMLGTDPDQALQAQGLL